MSKDEVLKAIKESVMASPLLGCLLEGASCKPESCDCGQAPIVAPSKFDKDLLARMYPRRVKAADRAEAPA